MVSTADATPARPNILFIMVDDLAPVLGAYGGQAKTPNFDRLAAEGALFENAHVNAVSCNPSRISMLIGLRPASTGITSLADEHVDWRAFLADPNSPGYQNYGPGINQIKTIFEHFKDNGYFVANAGKTFHNNEQLSEDWWDLRYYWDFWPGLGWPTNRPLSGLDAYYQATGADWGAIESARKSDGSAYTESDLPDYKVAQNALEIVAALPADRPFFVGVGFLLPHLPWYVPQRLLDLYPLDEIDLPAVTSNDLEDLPPEGLALVWQGGQFYDQRYIFDEEMQWRRVIAHYLAGTSYVDEQVGRLLDALERRGMLDNTIVVVWGDHGYHFGQKQHLQKHTIWEESTRIPLIVRAPGVSAPGSRPKAVVNSVDIFPTLVELAGLSMPDDFPRDGRSFVRLLQDANASWPWPAVTSLGRWADPAVDRAALRTPGWRYINYDLDGSSPQPQEELYFHPVDPYEWRNLLSPINGDPTEYRGVRIFLEEMLRGQNRPDAPPMAHNANVQGTPELAFSIRLTGEDANLDYLLFTVETLPQNGRLFESSDGMVRGEIITQPGAMIPAQPGWSAWVIYEPDPDATTDDFRFGVSDGRNKALGRVNIALTRTPLHQISFPFLTRQGFP